VVMMASSRQWLDARLRHFRYALVIGLERPLAARVYPIEPGDAARGGLEVAPGTAPGAPGAPAAGHGVFGLPPPRLRTPVEDEVRRKLERLEGVAGRKGL